jgi:ribose-phosphate pyrophosphokinase
MISTAGTVAESVKALLALGARPEIIIAATHGLFTAGSFDKLNDPAVREVFVTDTVSVAGKDRQRLQVVSIAPLIARALERFLAGRPQRKEIHDTTIFS